MSIFSRNAGDMEIRRITGGEVRILSHGTGKNAVTLSPMRSLSLEDFTFPFQNTAKIRDALKLQALPYMAAGSLEIFPSVLSKSGRNSSGIVWYVSPDELNIPDTGTSKIWPAPLALVSGLSEYGGNGVTMWADEENICSMLWQSNRPVMYRWRRRTDGASEREFSLYDEYCSSGNLVRGGDFFVDVSRGITPDISGVVSRSMNICPWIGEVNLSRSVLEGARDLERTLSILTRVMIWLLVTGGIVLGGEALRYYSLTEETQKARQRNESYYRETFDPERTGRISNPVTLARDKIASVMGKGEEGRGLDDVLADLGEVFSDMKDSKITLDIVRYNSAGIDCTGTAPDMTTVLNFRSAWEDRANLVQADNTQFVSGIGYRFDIRIRW